MCIYSVLYGLYRFIKKLMKFPAISQVSSWNQSPRVSREFSIVVLVFLRELSGKFSGQPSLLY